jgi:hypothetical protein
MRYSEKSRVWFLTPCFSLSIQPIHLCDLGVPGIPSNLLDTNTSDDKFITPEIHIRKIQSVQVLYTGQGRVIRDLTTHSTRYRYQVERFQVQPILFKTLSCDRPENLPDTSLQECLECPRPPKFHAFSRNNCTIIWELLIGFECVNNMKASHAPHMKLQMVRPGVHGRSRLTVQRMLCLF